jgi:hypothetical protein
VKTVELSWRCEMKAMGKGSAYNGAPARAPARLPAAQLYTSRALRTPRRVAGHTRVL